MDIGPSAVDVRPPRGFKDVPWLATNSAHTPLRPRLGRSAWLYTRRNAGFARDLFGRDINAPDELAYCRAFVHRERGSTKRLLASFERLADLDADVVDGPHTAALLGLAYEQHLPLKRWMWRRGLLAAADGRPPAEIDWP